MFWRAEPKEFLSMTVTLGTTPSESFTLPESVSCCARPAVPNSTNPNIQGHTCNSILGGPPDLTKILQQTNAMQPWLLSLECDITEHRYEMCRDSGSQWQERREYGKTGGTACPTAPKQAFSLLQLLPRLLAAGCWLAICNASSPQVPSVRVPIVNGGDLAFTHLSLEKAPALWLA